MHYLVGIGALLLVAFIAPAKASLSLLFIVLASILSVLVLSRLVAEVQVSVAESVRAIALSIALLVVAATVFGSFVSGTGIRSFAGASGSAVFLWFAIAYALGFAISLRLSLSRSMVIAVGTAATASLAVALVSKVAP